jgi:hypothetical protein
MPSGENWARGFSIPVAYAKDATATWEQWGAGIWTGFAAMFSELMKDAAAQLPKLPVIIPAGHHVRKFAGGSTLVFRYTLKGFMPRPACLPENQAVPAVVPAAVEKLQQLPRPVCAEPQATPRAAQQSPANDPASPSSAPSSSEPSNGATEGAGLIDIEGAAF